MALAFLDQTYIWHPFTQHKTARPPLPIVRAKGVYLYDENGKSYLDGIASWWVNLHGHAHPYIAEKIAAQAHLLEHVGFGDCTHPPAAALASRLITLLPGEMAKIFFSDNGSTAIEVALKMALQYGYPTKKEIICLKNSYHGDTFGAMSAAGRNAFNKPFWSHLFDVTAIDPNEEQLHRVLERGQAACFIFEPLIQGVGGMRIYPKAILEKLLRVCRHYDVLTIADEVMTGFGRTGTLFACEQLCEKPDMICLSKGLTGGFLPLGATAVTEQIFNAFLGENLSSAFLHGHSYTANPLACTSALASLDLLLAEKCRLQRERIAAAHVAFCKARHPQFKRCESLGAILAVECHAESSYFHAGRDNLYHHFLDRGILLRPLGNVLYVLPPYCMENDELQIIYDHILSI